MKSTDNNEKCPYIMRDYQVQRIKRAKENIIKKNNNPPTLVELSQEVKLSLRKL